MTNSEGRILLPESISILPIYHKNEIRISILRLDQIHPVISGNKLFKLYYYLTDAINSPPKHLITFGGAFSNHLVATAFACKSYGINCTGIVRGDEGETNSPSLISCLKYGMKLRFMNRQRFKKIAENPIGNQLFDAGKNIIIPMGGFGKEGARGAELINNYISEERYTHICVPVGTATTLAGLLLRDRKEKVFAFPALKGLRDINDRLARLGVGSTKRLTVISDFHFGGFARKSKELTDFMNWFYRQYSIPLDFVYSGKMMFGIFNMMDNGFFPPGTNILVIHTGGLQGNRSLLPGVLNY